MERTKEAFKIARKQVIGLCRVAEKYVIAIAWSGHIKALFAVTAPRWPEYA